MRKALMVGALALALAACSDNPTGACPSEQWETYFADTDGERTASPDPYFVVEVPGLECFYDVSEETNAEIEAQRAARMCNCEQDAAALP